MRAILSMLALLILTMPMAWAQKPEVVRYVPEIVGYVAKIIPATGKANARLGNNAARPLKRFSPLYQNDLIMPATGAQVLVRFAYGSQTIKDGEPAAARHVSPPPLPPNDPRTRLMRGLLDAQRRQFSEASKNVSTVTRGFGPPQIIEAILPRKLTLSQNLRFQWSQKDEGKGPVTLMLYDNTGHPIWSRSHIEADHLLYPTDSSDAPRLQPGIVYRWEVVLTADTNVNAQASFAIASPRVENEINEQLNVVEELKSADEEEKRMARASLLMNHALYTNAVLELEPLPKETASPLVCAMLKEAWIKMSPPDVPDDGRKPTPVRQEQLSTKPISDERGHVKKDPLFDQWNPKTDSDSAQTPAITKKERP